VLGVLQCARWIALPAVVENYARVATTWVIGIMAAYWFIERLAGFAT
jgi:hypothetical protein